MASAQPATPQRLSADSRGLAAGITSLAFTAFNLTGGLWMWAGVAGPWFTFG